MSEFLEKLKELDNYTETENGAIALKSTGSKLLDAFGKLGGMKDSPEEDIISTFFKAFEEEPELSMKLLFYIRDIRGGQGMRRVFRIIVKELASRDEETQRLVVENLDNFLFFGRGDDVLCLLDTPIKKEVVEWIGTTLECDLISVQDKGAFPTLLAKWLPSENTSSQVTRRYAREIIKCLNISPKHYRHILSTLRKSIGIVETLMSQNRWEEIDFEKLPSKASMIYSDAFYKHVQDNYLEYIKKLATGDAKINAGALFPYDIVHKIFNDTIKPKDRYLLDALWKSLPDYFEGKEETGMCVVDTSGSMYGTPMEVAYSLGLYCADKAKGPFHNHFITFSANPKLQEIKGDNVVDKIHDMDLGICENTNIEKVFDLILRTAKANNLKQEDLPSKLYIISDMQWDNCVMDNSNCGNNGGRVNYSLKPETFIATMRKRYAENGYDLPALVYWNVRTSKCGMFQQGKDEDSCCMVSGYSPSLFKAVIEGTQFEEEVVVDKETGEKKIVTKQKIDPIHVMLTTLNNERYNRVICKVVSEADNEG